MVIGGFVYLAIKNQTEITIDKSIDLYNVASDVIIPQPDKCQVGDIVTVTKVIDGDTIVVEGGSRIRLLGIDADEKKYPCYDVAKKRLETLILGKQVALQKDITDVDQYGRCLRYVFESSENINEQLVREGQAIASFYEYDVKYRKDIIEAEKYAIDNRMGCKWSQKYK